jgi:hypothetical protein
VLIELNMWGGVQQNIPIIHFARGTPEGDGPTLRVRRKKDDAELPSMPQDGIIEVGRRIPDVPAKHAAEPDMPQGSSQWRGAKITANRVDVC